MLAKPMNDVSPAFYLTKVMIYNIIYHPLLWLESNEEGTVKSQVLVLVPSKGKRFFLTDGEKRLELRNAAEVLRVISGREATLLGIMGGPGQNVFVRTMQMGIPVWRIPWYKLEALTGLAVKTQTSEKASAIDRAWSEHPDAFYQLEPIEPRVMTLRELTRVRLSIQETFRKPADLQYKSALRELSILLPEGEELIDLRTFFSNPQFVAGAKADEEELGGRILKLVKLHPLWEYIHPGKDSVLPPIKGLGPSLGGAILAEIVDIRRFPERENLRAYARFHVQNGQFPKRIRGQISAWNRYLNRAVYWWTVDQVPRYDSPWRDLYLWHKAAEMKMHPEALPREYIDKQGRKRIIWDFTLQHIHVRTARWTGSQMLNYLFDLWQAVSRGEDPELWYPTTSWPTYFARVGSELPDALAYLEVEIPKRRRAEPKEEEEEEF
jgi:hypothetical protein